MQIDPLTRIDSTEAQPGKILVYYYTLTNIDRDSFERDAFVREMKRQLIANYKTNSEMEGMRKAGVTLSYSYRFEDGTVAAELNISPDDL